MELHSGRLEYKNLNHSESKTVLPIPKAALPVCFYGLKLATAQRSPSSFPATQRLQGFANCNKKFCFRSAAKSTAYPGTPPASMWLASVTSCDHTSYCHFRRPITPHRTFPEWTPTRMLMSTPVASRTFLWRAQSRRIFFFLRGALHNFMLFFSSDLQSYFFVQLVSLILTDCIIHLTCTNKEFRTRTGIATRIFIFLFEVIIVFRKQLFQSEMKIPSQLKHNKIRHRGAQHQMASLDPSVIKSQRRYANILWHTRWCVSKEERN